MHLYLRILPIAILGVALVMISILGFHIGGEELFKVGLYSPLVGAFLGGGLVLFSVNSPFRPDEQVEPWFEHEKAGWRLIGWGCLMWGMGEAYWRYSIAFRHSQDPFPSFADLGYISFFPLVLAGLILQHYSANRAKRKIFLLLDSLITMGALLSIAWFIRLGYLAQTPDMSIVEKGFALYYITTDVTLVICVFLLLLREPDHPPLLSPRRIGLILLACGLTIYSISDFFFDLWKSMGLSVDGSWIDLGWPLGMMTIGLAAFTRRFLPTRTMGISLEENTQQQPASYRFGLSQTLPYILLILLFAVLLINVLSNESMQGHIRPVLAISTFFVFILVLVRQIITILENNRLMREQVKTLKQLEQVYQCIERRQAELEAGVAHLKGIQTRLANGDIRARAHTLSGELWPLANGLNLMADRMMRMEQNQRYAQKALNSIEDICQMLERRKGGIPFVLPASSLDVPPEVHHLLQIIGLNITSNYPPQPQHQPAQRDFPERKHIPFSNTPEQIS